MQKQRNKSQFLNILTQKRLMMLNELVPFFKPTELVDLCLLCKTVNHIVDNNKYHKYNTSHHLKSIAAQNYLKISFNNGLIENIQIDTALHCDIQELSDFKNMDGRYFKDLLVQEFKKQPVLNKFRYPNPPAKEDRQNSDVIMRQWNQVFDKNVMEYKQDLENPLPNLIEKMKIDFELGGFFIIKQLKWYPHGQMYTDLWLLVDSVESQEQYDLLQQMHLKSIQIQNMEQNKRNNDSFALDDYKHLLNGVGRVVQYFNPYPDHMRDFNQYSQNFVWSLFEGQVNNGIGHGFARIIYGDTGKSYSGYYNKGIKHGYGIQSMSDGTIQAQGIFKGNETLAVREEVKSFKVNVEPPQIEEKYLIKITQNEEDSDEQDQEQQNDNI